MEERYKQIVAFIERLAASNPYITCEQIAKAKSMYNGDDRPIEIIQAELEAYSAQIEAQGKKSENDRMMQTTRHDESQTLKKEENSSNNPSATGNVPPVQEANLTGIIPPQPKYIPTMSEQDKHQNELESIFEYTSGPSDLNIADQFYSSASESNLINYDNTPKKLVKTPSQNTSVETPSTGDDGGYGNLEAILSLTIIFSIVTIIMGLFTIVLK